MGNLPCDMTDHDLRNALHECWVSHAGQRDDIYIENVAGRLERVRGWIGYSLKEAELYRNHDAWDFENTQIPHDALAAG
jgi:hypothetical protein